MRREVRAAFAAKPASGPGALAVFWLLLGVALPACGNDREPRPDAHVGTGAPLLVLAASDLQAAFDTLVPLFRARTGERVDVMLGSTGNLASQIRHGAPADLFFAANASFLDGLVDAGRVDPASRRVYAVGRLALVAPPGAPPPPSLRSLAEARFRLVAIANPEHAPYGIAARQALRAAGAWDAVSDRLVLGENIAQTLHFVRSGNADAGIVALGLVMGTEGASGPGGGDPPLRWTLVDDALHEPLIQVAGMVRGNTASGGTDDGRAARATAFLDFILSPEGREILERFGFEPPASERP